MIIIRSRLIATLTLATVVVLSGCDDHDQLQSNAEAPLEQAAGIANASRATADQVISSVFARSAESPAMLEMLKQQPEYELLKTCVELQLASQGWTAEKHEFFMTATGGSGDMNNINKDQYSELQFATYFVPVMTTSAECMEAASY